MCDAPILGRAERSRPLLSGSWLALLGRRSLRLGLLGRRVLGDGRDHRLLLRGRLGHGGWWLRRWWLRRRRRGWRHVLDDLVLDDRFRVRLETPKHRGLSLPPREVL